MSSHTIPVTITPEAAEYVAELGMQEPLQQMLDHALATIPGLRSIVVNLQPPYDTGPEPHVIIDVTMSNPHVDRDLTEDRWIRWFTAEFPPQVCQHFCLLTVYGPEHAG